jgi:hypothetical protein
MGKLGKRETIILAVMVIAILFAAYDFLSSRGKNSAAGKSQMTSDQKAADLNQFVAALNAGAAKDSGGAATLVLSRAEKPWQQDPFLGSRVFKAWAQARAPVKEAAAGGPPKIEFAYSGYLEAGKKRMAIINGMEYREGEALEKKEFVLKSFTQERAVIENRGTGATVTVPLQE